MVLLAIQTPWQYKVVLYIAAWSKVRGWKLNRYQKGECAFTGSARDVHCQLTMKELSQARRCGMIGKKEYSVQMEETGLAYQNTADQKQIKRLDITGVRPLVNTKPISFLLMLLFFLCFAFCIGRFQKISIPYHGRL